MYLAFVFQSITYEDWGPFFWVLIDFFRPFLGAMLAVIVFGAVFAFFSRR